MPCKLCAQATYPCLVSSILRQIISCLIRFVLRKTPLFVGLDPWIQKKPYNSTLVNPYLLVKRHTLEFTHTALQVQTTHSWSKQYFHHTKHQLHHFKNLFQFIHKLFKFTSIINPFQKTTILSKNCYNPFLSSHTKSLENSSEDQNQLTSKHFQDTIITMFPKINE